MLKMWRPLIIYITICSYHDNPITIVLATDILDKCNIVWSLKWVMLFVGPAHLVPCVVRVQYTGLFSLHFTWLVVKLDEVQRMRNAPDLFNKLVDSIAPTVFGHQDIKRALLLMLFGGVHNFTYGGIKRGHRCLYCWWSQLCKISVPQVSCLFHSESHSSAAAASFLK